MLYWTFLLQDVLIADAVLSRVPSSLSHATCFLLAAIEKAKREVTASRSEQDEAALFT